MNRNIIKTGLILLIVFFTLNFLFSLFEIYNLSGLYKDQVEIMAIGNDKKDITDNFCWDLINKASGLTSLKDFFIYSAITSPFLVLYLTTLIRKIK